jgi:hypothetical protein
MSAPRLLDCDIPLVFVTGYGRESIDRRYSFVKVLEKPVGRQALEGLFAQHQDCRAWRRPRRPRSRQRRRLEGWRQTANSQKSFETRPADAPQDEV